MKGRFLHNFHYQIVGWEVCDVKVKCPFFYMDNCLKFVETKYNVLKLT